MRRKLDAVFSKEVSGTSPNDMVEGDIAVVLTPEGYVGEVMFRTSSGHHVISDNLGGTRYWPAKGYGFESSHKGSPGFYFGNEWNVRVLRTGESLTLTKTK